MSTRFSGGESSTRIFFVSFFQERTKQQWEEEVQAWPENKSIPRVGLFWVITLCYTCSLVSTFLLETCAKSQRKKIGKIKSWILSHYKSKKALLCGLCSKKGTSGERIRLFEEHQTKMWTGEGEGIWQRSRLVCIQQGNKAAGISLSKPDSKLLSWAYIKLAKPGREVCVCMCVCLF